MSGKGLEGVVAAQTRISRVLGEEGRLIYSGYEIEDLAENVSFEEVCYLLWNGELPGESALTQLRDEFFDALRLDGRIAGIIRAAPQGTHPMATLRTAISALSFVDSEAESMDEDANRRKAVRLVAQSVALTAATERIRKGRDPLEPKRELSLAGNLYYLTFADEPDAITERILDAALTLHAEHGLNASTFAARVTAATLSDMHSAVTSAIGTLKGPLHGGANERVMKMLLAIERPDNAERWVMNALERGDKIMGFGHRVYRALDPRAPILKQLAGKLSARGGDTRYLEISERIQDVMAREMEKRGKKIYPNVDFFSASVYYTLGIDLDLFTNLFAVARMSGWTAHVLEQWQDNRLIRPKAEYIGPDNRTVTPMAQRA